MERSHSFWIDLPDSLVLSGISMICKYSSAAGGMVKTTDLDDIEHFRSANTSRGQFVDFEYCLALIGFPMDSPQPRRNHPSPLVLESGKSCCRVSTKPAHSPPLLVGVVANDGVFVSDRHGHS
jgi:hypothetical protein